jgi:hypothetical protein
MASQKKYYLNKKLHNAIYFTLPLPFWQQFVPVSRVHDFNMMSQSRFLTAHSTLFLQVINLMDRKEG